MTRTQTQIYDSGSPVEVGDYVVGRGRNGDGLDWGRLDKVHADGTGTVTVTWFNHRRSQDTRRPVAGLVAYTECAVARREYKRAVAAARDAEGGAR
ncbi:MAG: hypothetical protein QME96_06265 [Myxococcota bacterium]|nr:hypothetical protein [Myxococcota bacterium]